MINANEYETREDLEKAMRQMHREQLVQLMRGSYGLIENDIDHMSLLISYPFDNKCATLDKQAIYWTADRIEELATHLVRTCSIMKSTCRLIPDELKEKEDANRSTTSVSESD